MVTVVDETERQTILAREASDKAIIDNLDRELGQESEQFRAQTGWLLASLIALNGGGMATVMSDRYAGAGSLLPPALFFSGLLAVLLSGISTTFALQGTIHVAAMRLVRWKLLAATGNSDLARESDSYQGHDQRNELLARIGSYAGIASACCFAAGGLTSGWAMKETMDAGAARCLAIQRDMLSARPRRADSPDLFKSLNCRPQGEGSVYAPRRDAKPSQKLAKPRNSSMP